MWADARPISSRAISIRAGEFHAGVLPPARLIGYAAIMPPISPRLLMVMLLQLLLICGVWHWIGRPQSGGPDALTDRFNSLSYAPYRPGESPLNGHYPSRAEIDADLALLSPRINSIRTYASAEGTVDVPALAQKHGLKMWEGIWLGTDRVKNAQEIAAGIAAAHRYGATIDRVVVGNEVLLRRDLPVDELIADIDLVRSQVKQPVTYADVQDFWEEFPQVAPHVDIVTVHLLPYWEDQPTDIEGAVAHIDAVYHRMQSLFPGQKIAIGETGWPSRGRWRDAAAPTIVNETKFVRQFINLATREGFDYNLIEAFDQNWKAIGEGTVGARWGLWTSEREPKIPLKGPVSDDPYWLSHALISGLAMIALMAVALAGPPIPGRIALSLSVIAMLLGLAMGYAVGETWPDLYNLDLGVAAAVNLPSQLLLAALAMRRFRARLMGQRLPRPRTGADATRFARELVLMRFPVMRGSHLFDDMSFLFTWTALVLQILLVTDGRYRDFPTPNFIVPVLLVLLRAMLADLPSGGGGIEEWALGLSLGGLALVSIAQETLVNQQALGWNVMALLLAAAQLLRAGGGRPGRPHEEMSQLYRTSASRLDGK